MSRLPSAPKIYDPATFNLIISDIERATANSAGGAIRNFAAVTSNKRRTFDASTVTLQELAEVVATLISDIGDTD